jgi:hypothetical protein
LPDERTQIEENIIPLKHLKLVKVYTDISAVRENLTDSRYVLVDDMQNADIIFSYKHFKEFK